MNAWLRTVIVAPMTTADRDYPSRVAIAFDGKDGQVALDQIRTIDKKRMLKRLGKAPDDTAQALCSTLVEMFAY